MARRLSSIIVIHLLSIVSECCGSLTLMSLPVMPHVERHKRDAHLNYKYAWIKQCSIDFSTNSSKPTGTSIELAVTEMVDDYVMEKAARLIQLMTRFIDPKAIDFVSLITFGIFSSKQLLTDAFPEYNVSTECKFSCDGACKSLCYNGIPRANSSSYPGRRVIVVDSNILCSDDDPEKGTLNLLIKTFAESMMTFLFPPDILQLFGKNYENVKTVWNIRPDNVQTYWSEAVVTWFHSRTSRGEMNVCGTSGELCTTEWENRENIKNKDPFLYNNLNSLFNYGRHYLVGKISTCQW